MSYEQEFSWFICSPIFINFRLNSRRVLVMDRTCFSGANHLLDQGRPSCYVVLMLLEVEVLFF